MNMTAGTHGEDAAVRGVLVGYLVRWRRPTLHLPVDRFSTADVAGHLDSHAG